MIIYHTIVSLCMMDNCSLHSLLKYTCYIFIGIFYNGNNGKCFDIRQEYVQCADPTGCGTGNTAKAWDYQVCWYALGSTVGTIVLVFITEYLAK